MSARTINDLCKSSGPTPYGPNWRWNGSGWTFVRCDLQALPGGSASAPAYQSAFGGGALDGSADVGIVGIEVPRPNTPPNVLQPGGSIGEPVVEDGEDVDCACKAKGGARSILWLVGVGMLLWLI